MSATLALFATPTRGMYYDLADPDNAIPVMIVGVEDTGDGVSVLVVDDDGDLFFVPVNRVTFVELAERLP